MDVDDSVRADHDEVLTTTDVITLHVSLSDAVKNLISREMLARLKGGAIVVNVSRGASSLSSLWRGAP